MQAATNPAPIMPTPPPTPTSIANPGGVSMVHTARVAKSDTKIPNWAAARR